MTTFAVHLNGPLLTTFSKLGLSKEVLEVLDTLGFKKPTPVQEKAIPLLLSNDKTDFIGLAQTGTGKTAAFGLPLIERIDSSKRTPQALIMAPTRELGQQIAEQLVNFSRGIKALNVEVVYGGAAISNQIRNLKKPTQIVVATPGRLLDLIKRKALSLESVDHVVLDEADEMLNMGFKEDIDRILSFTKEDRVTWLFSATMPAEIRKIVKKYMDNPQEVSITPEERINKDISHKYVITTPTNKIPALRAFLDIQPDMRGIMFCRTKRETQRISDALGKEGYTVAALHGDLSQAQRDKVMKRFKKRSMQLLIATDVAARGIDVDDLTHVLHHKLPDNLESYTHRSGRTGRVGKKGISLAFIGSNEKRRISEIQKKTKITFEEIEVPSTAHLKTSRMNNWAKLIVNTQVDAQADSILKEIEGQFKELSKEDILKRLITSQLDHLTTQSGEVRSPVERKPRESKPKPSTTGGGDNMRFFINLGSIDGVTKGDLVHFLSDVTGVKRRAFNNVELQKNCAFFEVNSVNAKGLKGKFEGYEIEGRDIRVSRDNGPKKQSSSTREESTTEERPATRGNRHTPPRSRKRGTGSPYAKAKSGKRKQRKRVGDFKRKKRR